jgi:hypothetical protein
MKLLLTISLPVLTLLAADTPAKNKPAQTAAAQASAAPAQIPPDAVESEPGSFRYVDAKGTKWVYRRTPFGVARWQDDPAADAARKAEYAKSFDDVTAIEDGNSIRFERPSPFGVYRWKQKKSDLNEMEQAVWARTRVAVKD